MYVGKQSMFLGSRQEQVNRLKRWGSMNSGYHISDVTAYSRGLDISDALMVGTVDISDSAAIIADNHVRPRRKGLFMSLVSSNPNSWVFFKTNTNGTPLLSTDGINPISYRLTDPTAVDSDAGTFPATPHRTQGNITGGAGFADYEDQFPTTDMDNAQNWAVERMSAIHMGGDTALEAKAILAASYVGPVVLQIGKNVYEVSVFPISRVKDDTCTINYTEQAHCSQRHSKKRGPVHHWSVLHTEFAGQAVKFPVQNMLIATERNTELGQAYNLTTNLIYIRLDKLVAGTSLRTASATDGILDSFVAGADDALLTETEAIAAELDITSAAGKFYGINANVASDYMIYPNNDQWSYDYNLVVGANPTTLFKGVGRFSASSVMPGTVHGFRRPYVPYQSFTFGKIAVSGTDFSENPLIDFSTRQSINMNGAYSSFHTRNNDFIMRGGRGYVSGRTMPIVALSRADVFKTSTPASFQANSNNERNRANQGFKERTLSLSDQIVKNITDRKAGVIGRFVSKLRGK